MNPTVTLSQAVILGLVQGLTEFLPISSSGHLVLAQTLLGLSEPPVLLDIILHTGTLMAILIFLPRRIKHLSRALLYAIAVGTVPAIVFGLLLLPLVDRLFSSLWLLGLGFIISGYLMLQTTKFLKLPISLSTLGPKRALTIGLYQAAAILPSLSRSGSTIYAALKLGVNRQAAFTFSFLLAVPAILGATLTQVPSLARIQPKDSLVLGVGFITAFLVSLFALKLLERLVLSNKLAYFGYYCFAIGAFSFWLAFIQK